MGDLSGLFLSVSSRLVIRMGEVEELQGVISAAFFCPCRQFVGERRRI